MRKTYARKLDHKTLTTVRQNRAVASVEEGHSPEIVAKTMGIARTTMYGWQDTGMAAGALWMPASGVDGLLSWMGRPCSGFFAR